jgi:tetratricopeptide (TPR) repeat protein
MRELLQEQNAWELEPIAREAAAANPNNPEVLYYLSEALLLAWNYTEAIDNLKKLIELEPASIKHKQRLAYAQNQAGEYDAAVETYKELIALQPQDMVLIAGLADVYMKLWKNEEAIPLLDQALAADGANYYNRLLRARALVSLQDYDKALVDVEAIKDGEFFESAQLLMIEIYKLKENPEKVLELYKNLNETYPDNTSNGANMAAYLVSLGRTEEAIEQYTTVIHKEMELGWDTNFNQKARAAIYLQTNQYDLALGDLNTVIEKNPDETDAFAQRAQVYLAMGDSDQALADISHALELTGEDGYSRNNYLKIRAEMYAAVKNYAAALNDYEALSQDDFYSGEAFYGMGMVAKEQGDLKMALDYWNKAKEKHNFNAQNAIDQYCGPLLEEAADAKAAELEKEFAPEFVKNAQSPFLQSIFGKIWKVDMDKTSTMMPQLQNLPEGMRGMIMAAFEVISLTLTDRGLFMANPSKDDIRAFYRIEEQGPDFVKIYGVPTNGKEPKHLALSKDGNNLVFDPGSPDGTKLYMKEASLEEMSDEERESFEDKMKVLASQFLGEMTNVLKDAFKAKG